VNLARVDEPNFIAILKLKQKKQNKLGTEVKKVRKKKKTANHVYTNLPFRPAETNNYIPKLFLVT